MPQRNRPPEEQCILSTRAAFSIWILELKVKEPEQEVQDAGHEESEFWGPQRQSTEDRWAW